MDLGIPTSSQTSVPYGQALKMWSTCSSNRYTKESDSRIFRFFRRMRTLTRELLDEIQRVLTLTQEECLQTKRRQPMEHIPVIITCIPYANSLQKLRNDVGTFVNQKIFNKSPLVKYRRPKGLRYRLVSTKFRNSKLKDGELFTRVARTKRSSD